MRSVQRDKRSALAVFHDTYDLRRTMWQEHQRKLREARERQTVRQQQREPASQPVNVSPRQICQPEGEHAGVSYACVL